MMLNFDVGPAIPPVEGPTLNVRQEGQEIVVTAPHEAASHRLEGTLSIGPDVLWTPITVTPTHAAAGLEFRLQKEGAARFFRLVMP